MQHKKHLIGAVVFALLVILIVASHATAKQPVTEREPEIAVTIPVKTEYTDQEVSELTKQYAKKYAVSENTMLLVTWNESHFMQHAKGDDGKSIGACQISLKHNPGITFEQANDPNFCLDFMGQKISQGHGRMWTAYRTCILNEKIIYKGKQIVCNRNIKTTW